MQYLIIFIQAAIGVGIGMLVYRFFWPKKTVGTFTINYADPMENLVGMELNTDLEEIETTPLVEPETNNVSDTADEEPSTQESNPTPIEAVSTTPTDSNDPLLLFSQGSAIPTDDETDESVENEYETGDNTFPDETLEPPAAPNYRNRE